MRNCRKRYLKKLTVGMMIGQLVAQGAGSERILWN